ncbi:MAG: HEPN domain-containing protein [Planctomycetes bacterium]|nr:HEPN domain-containing protein [Planctomycetota bacterium]
MSSDSSCSAEWIELARADRKRADILLDADDPVGAAFHLQQAIEKLLKASLLAKGRQVRRTHDLEMLLDELGLPEEKSDVFRGTCRDLTFLYIATRYPVGGIPQIDVAEVKTWMQAASDLFELLSNVHLPNRKEKNHD